MKTSFLQQPKIIIPIAAALALVIGFFAYGMIGRAPVVNIPSDTSTNPNVVGTNAGDNSVDLAFPLSGRVASVSVKVGDNVTKGEVLATLDAGNALGAVAQAKGALELAEAQYASLDVAFSNAKKQQDVLVENAYRTLLSSGLSAVPSIQDDTHVPIISGTYTCDKEGSYEIDPYLSGTSSGYSFSYSGLETGIGAVTYSIPTPLGICGLYVQFVPSFSEVTKWTITIPNTKSPNYLTNKNAYDLAVATRDQTLSQYAANLGQNGSEAANTSKAAVDAAEGAYQSALGNYQNYLIIAPESGTVSFIDADLKAGQSVTQNKVVITLTTK